MFYHGDKAWTQETKKKKSGQGEQRAHMGAIQGRIITWEAEFECLVPGMRMRFYCLRNGSNESYSWFTNRRS